MTQPAYITTLTPLRGIAAILVLIFHSGLFLRPLLDPNVSHLLENAWLWVDFFFVLSGFILSHVYGANFQQSIRKGDYKRYLLARFARVYPLHLITLLWVAGITVWIRSIAIGPLPPFVLAVFDYKAIPTSLLMIQALYLHDTPPLNTVAWSLSTEWWLYVLFPLLVIPFFRLKSTGRVVVLLLIAGLYTVLMYYVVPRFSLHDGRPVGSPTINTTHDFALLRCLAGFALGMLSYESYRTRWGYASLKKSSVFTFCFAGILAAMHFDAHQLLIVALFPLAVLSAAYNTSGLKRLLEARPLQRLGDWSFSIYMVHIPLVFVYYAYLVAKDPTLFTRPPQGFGPNPDYLEGWGYCLVLVAVTLPAAALLYRYVEVPSRKFINALFKTARPEPVAAP